MNALGYDSGSCPSTCTRTPTYGSPIPQTRRPGPFSPNGIRLVVILEDEHGLLRQGDSLPRPSVFQEFRAAARVLALESGDITLLA